MAPRIVVIDNYDSFVYNLVQYLGELGAEPIVYRNDERSVEELLALGPDGLLVSPGPGRPESAGVSLGAIEEFGRRQIPVLGVCLGHQCIGEAFGAVVSSASVLMHGKTSMISHDGRGVFLELPDPFEATRYHSLIVEAGSIPEILEVSATSEDGLVMGLRHRELPIEGVQFHPESILTGAGHQLLANFLAALSRSPA
jgi:anthranilate synthase component II